MKPTPEDIIQAIFDMAGEALRVEAGPAFAGFLSPGVPEQYVGTVGVTAIAVAFSGPTKHLHVSNPSKNATIEVSFNGGASFVKVLGEQSLSLPCRVSQIHVRSGGGSQLYEVVATV